MQIHMSTNAMTPAYWADWLVDAVATATQDRRFLRGDEQHDKLATDAIFENAVKAMEQLLKNQAR
jgi:hypothetical protein